MKILNIGGHGIGDNLTSLQISYFFKLKGIEHINVSSCRNEVFRPLSVFFPDLIKVDEKYSHGNEIIYNLELEKELLNKFSCDLINYNVPDLLFRNPRSLNLEKLGLSIQIIKKHRLLLNQSLNKQRNIFLGFSSSTPGYIYPYIKKLCQYICAALPDYHFIFPKPNSWDKPIIYGDLNSLKNISNLEILEDPNFEDILQKLKSCCYGVFSCNGPSHLAYHLGIPRLILDPQFNKLPWIARWKEDYEECIDINNVPEEVEKLITTNIRIPQTQLIPRQKVLENLYKNWGNELIIKY